MLSLPAVEAKNQKGKVVLPLPAIEFSQADFERIKQITGKDDPTLNVATWIKHFLTTYINGGILLSQGELKQIERATGTQIASGKAVVDLACKARGMADGQYVFPCRLDPVWVEPLKQTAEQQGVTPEYLLEDVANAVVDADGPAWAYSWHCQRKTNYTAEDWKTIQAFAGKDHPFGADIAARAREVMGKA